MLGLLQLRLFPWLQNTVLSLTHNASGGHAGCLVMAISFSKFADLLNTIQTLERWVCVLVGNSNFM